MTFFKFWLSINHMKAEVLGSTKAGERGVHHKPSIKNNELLARFLHFSAVQRSHNKFLLSSMTNG